jgi:hypothetical protein
MLRGVADIRSGLRLFCQQLEDLRARAGSPADNAEIEALAAAAREGQDIEERRAILAARLGIKYRRTRDIAGLLGLGDGHTVPELYVCPGGLCSRTWLNVPGKGGPPLCALTAAPLRPE